MREGERKEESSRLPVCFSPHVKRLSLAPSVSTPLSDSGQGIYSFDFIARSILIQRHVKMGSWEKSDQKLDQRRFCATISL